MSLCVCMCVNFVNSVTSRVWARLGVLLRASVLDGEGVRGSE